MTNGIIIIKKGREKPILQQHPWIFSGAIDSVEGDPAPGDIVTVTARDGRFLARGYWNPKSQIQVRILTWDDEDINEDWWRKMLKRAIDSRAMHQLQPWSYRLINAENDYIPGLVVDCYIEHFQKRWLVLQSLTLGIEANKNMIIRLLGELFKPDGIYERSDVDVRRKEGLELTTGLVWGKEPEKPFIETDGIEGMYDLLVDIKNGHKTGCYLDQQSNHRLLANYINLNERGSVLNLFSYTGAFGLSALKSGASYVVDVDASHEALELAENNTGFNKEHRDRNEFIQADVFDLLHDYADENKQFDVVILDPPKFAFNAGQVEKASRGYKDINLNAFKCVKPGGYLMTFSCSGAISADLFQKIVFGALADSGRQAQILKHLGPGDDHPVALTFPEGAYLKGLLLRVY